MNTIELDGSHGEGGGQILRSALTLSMITGVPFRIEHIRAGRSKPGLLRQHLAAVNAAAQICEASVEGAAPASSMLHFMPGKIRGGNYDFAIGTAGSCTLVLQTLLPALWFADGQSTVRISGGTHNSGAPPADFLSRTWLPLLSRMGGAMGVELLRHGFYPAGGGVLLASVRPLAVLQPFELLARGELLAVRATAIVAGLSSQVARRELAELQALLGGTLGELQEEIRVLPAREGPGNALLVELQYAEHCELFSAFGEKGLPAEAVARSAAKLVLDFHGGSAAVGEHLADQLLLPLALAGSGAFTTAKLSSHLQTNVQVIGRFLPVRFEFAELAGAHSVRLC